MSLEVEGPVKILGDHARLEQVFSNLIINALKYGNSKPVKVKVGSFNDSAFVSVEDQGVGIASEDQKRIFERFERVTSVRNISGIGLGLFISKNIVEAHQGTISVISEAGKGSTFKILLPKIKS